MKIENKTTKEDIQNEKMVLEVTAETWEENKLLAKGMGIEYPNNGYVECVVNLKKE